MAEKKEKPTIDLSKLNNAGALAEMGDENVVKAVKDSKRVPKAGKKKKGKFNFIKPVRVPLPSKGLLYKTDDEDINEGFILLTKMTPKDEEVLSTKEFLDKGVATRMILDNCIQSDIDAKDLLTFDSNYLLFKLRAMSYGTDYKISMKCPECGGKFKSTVDISKLSFEEIPDGFVEPIEIKLEDTGYTVTSMLPRMFHTERLYEVKKAKKIREGEVDTSLTDNMLALTLGIYDDEGLEVPRADWREFFESIPTSDRAQITDETKLDSGIDKIDGLKCPYANCQEDFSGSVPITAEFFRL